MNQQQNPSPKQKYAFVNIAEPMYLFATMNAAIAVIREPDMYINVARS